MLPEGAGAGGHHVGHAVAGPANKEEVKENAAGTLRGNRVPAMPEPLAITDPRTPGEVMVNRTIRLPAAVMAELDEHAHRLRLRPSQLLRHWTVEGIANLRDGGEGG